jgi:hypothetical protein
MRVTGSVAVDVAVGLVFTYLVFSTLCSAVNEAVSQFFNRRGRELFSTINGLLGNTIAQERFWDHPLISGLIRSRNLKQTAEPFLSKSADEIKAKFRTKTFKDIVPSYISPSTFARVLLDITGKTSALVAPSGGDQSQAVGAQPASPGTEQQPTGPPPAPTDASVTTPGPVSIPAVDSIMTAAGADITRAEKEIEKWFNDTMDRLSGYYKRWTKRLLLIFAVIVVIAFNVNTIQLAQSLWREPAVRAGVVQSAQNPTNPSSQTAAGQQATTAVDQALNLPIGWSSSTWHVDDGQWVWTIVGWLLSIGAVSLGAPFWFGVFGRITSLRSTGPPPQT